MTLDFRLKGFFVGAVTAIGVLAATQSGLASGGEDGHNHDDHQGIQKDRSDAMKAMGGAAKSTAQMLKGEIEYDAEKVKANAKIIADTAGDPLLALFPEGSNAAPTEALDIIWEDWDGFSAASALLKERAAGFSAAEGPQAVGIAFGATLKACGGCHKKFRVKKD
jgi:cytochrome c556